MKKLIYYIIIAISLITIGITSLLFYQELKPPVIYDTSQLTTLDGVKTTGAIPSENETAKESFNQIIQLASMGNIITPEFKISVSRYGKVKVEIPAPFEKNKQLALEWLKNNGFDKIEEGNIDFTNI